MAHSNPFGARSTADHVLAGVDLTGKRFVVTGCASGIGFETMNSLAANGARVIGLARVLGDAQTACKRAGPSCVPLGCDLSDLASVAAAAQSILASGAPLDGIVANAGIAKLPDLRTRHGVEMQFLVNHLGHFALINALSGIVRSGAGRIVIVTSQAAGKRAAAKLMLDNLDGRRFYDPQAFYDQSKIAAALYARELSRRLAGRGIAVNSVHPGATRGTGIDRHVNASMFRSLGALFMKNARRGAATQALLAASPSVAGISGEHWHDCRIAEGHPLLTDTGLAQRLWEVSDRLVTARTETTSERLQAAA